MADPNQYKLWEGGNSNGEKVPLAPGGGGGSSGSGGSGRGESAILDVVDAREYNVYTITAAHRTRRRDVDKAVEDLFKKYNSTADLRRDIIRRMHKQHVTRGSQMPTDIRKDMMTASRMGSEAKTAHSSVSSKGGKPGPFPDILTTPVGVPESW